MEPWRFYTWKPAIFGQFPAYAFGPSTTSEKKTKEQTIQKTRLKQHHH
jgi:hypothetical protein